MEVLEMIISVLSLFGISVVMYFLKKHFEDRTLINSLNNEVSGNIKIAKKNLRLLKNNGRNKPSSTLFTVDVYSKFKQSLSPRIKKKIGDTALELLSEGYLKCINFNKEQSIDLKMRKSTEKNYFKTCLETISSNFNDYIGCINGSRKATQKSDDLIRTVVTTVVLVIGISMPIEITKGTIDLLLYGILNAIIVLVIFGSYYITHSKEESFDFIKSLWSVIIISATFAIVNMINIEFFGLPFSLLYLIVIAEVAIFIPKIKARVKSKKIPMKSSL